MKKGKPQSHHSHNSELSAILLMPGCATSKKNSYKSARKSSYIDTSQLGRNKYFFSKKYQKKLYRFKKK